MKQKLDGTTHVAQTPQTPVSVHESGRTRGQPGSDDLDPQIREFVRIMSQRWAQHPSLDEVPVERARQIAEQVRSHWAKGGPTMASTIEKHIATQYGSVRVRALIPTHGSPKGALVYLHGGGWTLFSIDTHDRLMREYAARANVVVLGVDYALSPENKFPRAIEETVAVIRWIRENGSDLGIDGTRIAVGGDSAGAAMSVASSIILRDAGEADTVKAMLLNYGAFDASCGTRSFERYGAGGYLWGKGEMAAFWKNYLRNDDDATNPLAAPIHADVRGLPAAFLAIPECDVMYDESIAMGEKLRCAGVRAQSVVYPGATHSFLEAVSIARISDRAFTEASRWLADVLLE